MGNSKIVYYGETLIDLTEDTVEAAKLLKGFTAHDKSGDPITGTFEEVTPYAIISVTYPEGSVCTCSSGSVTLAAKDTSGKAMFIIPSAGTWTVKAVSGSDNVSKAVSITAEGQVETVTLAYELVLFDGNGGGDVTGITGGWQIIKASGASASVTETAIVFESISTENYGCKILTSNKINFNNYQEYDTIKIFCLSSSSTGAYFGLTDNTNRTSPMSIVRARFSSGKNIVLSAPLTYGIYYLGFEGASAPFNISVSKVWLEQGGTV